jgi:hypothetical protein
MEGKTEDIVVNGVVYAIALWDRERCARELRMSVRSLEKLGKGGPPKVRLGGRVWYRPAGVEQWLVAREK